MSHLRLIPVATLACAVLLAAGCASQLRVTTDPPGALVTVKDEQGKVVESGPSPLDAALQFSDEGDELYVVDVEPTIEQAELYLPASRRLTASGYAALPGAQTVTDTTKQLAFRLIEKSYVNLPLVEVMLTPQGQWVGLITRSRSYKDITEVGGLAPRLIVDFGENRGLNGLTLSPAGERIVYSEAVLDPPVDRLDTALDLSSDRILGLKGANLRGINIDGGGVLHLTTENFRDMFPTFTARGEQILFASNRRRNGLLDILRIKATGRSGISDIYVNHRNGMVLRPTAADDGTIAFAVANIDPATSTLTDTQVWTIGGPNEFPTQIARGTEPAISPDGRSIVYTAPDGNLWVTASDGSNQTSLTTNAAAIVDRYRDSLSPLERQRYDANASLGLVPVRPFTHPAWTPDGQRILFTSMEGSDADGRPNEDVWIMRPDGSDAQQLTTNGSADRYPQMSPDGRSVYFLSNRGQSWSIYQIPAPTETRGASNPLDGP